LHDVGYFCGDEVEERVYAQARRGLDLDGEFANCADGFADKVNVYFGSVSKRKGVSGVEDLRGGQDLLSQLCENFFDVLLRGEHEEKLQFRNFYIDRIIVFAKEDTDVVS
jgi:hypothetical protein